MHNQFDGEAQSVVQARDVGEVHFHARARPRMRCQVPAELVPYINNERPLGELDRWFTDGGTKVAVVRGAPGSGRTSLATQWVQTNRAKYPDGQFFVRLASGPDGAERERSALRELLLANGWAPDEIPTSLDGLANGWRSCSDGKRIAMVIDDALTAAQVRSLLPGAGDSAVLVTEAGRLGSLRASANATFVDIDPMAEPAARELLRRIAGDRIAEEPAAVGELIELCAGSTIALCVVATLLAEREWPVQRLAAKLRREEHTLRALSKDESLSVSVVFDAAYERLGKLARECYQVLGVHPGVGDVSADAVAAALGEPEEEVADALDDLVRARLAIESADGRFLLSGLVKRHAAAKADGDFVRPLIGYYADHAVATAWAMLPDRVWHKTLLPPAGVHADESWADAEQDNLRAVVAESFRRGEFESVCRFGIALWPFYERGGHAQDMAAVNELGVRAARERGDALAEAVLGFQLGFAHRQRGDLERAVQAFGEALELARRTANAELEATALESLGLARLDQHLLSDAARLLGESLELALQLDDPRRLALARFHLAKALPPARALPLLAEARLALAAEPGNLAKIDLWRGRKLIESGKLDEAAGILRGITAISRERGEVLCELAEIAVERGDVASARAQLTEAVEIFRQRGLSLLGVSARARLDELG